jgi:hypothetical protein
MKGGKGTNFAKAFDGGVLSDFNDGHSTVDQTPTKSTGFSDNRSSTAQCGTNSAELIPTAT